MTELDCLAEQRLGEILDMGLQSVEEWVQLEERARTHNLKTPTQAYEEYVETMSILNGCNK